MGAGESKAVDATILIASILFGAGALANIWYYNKIRRTVPTVGSTGAITCGISHDSALTLLWVNVILFVLALGLFIWALYRLFRDVNVKVTSNNLYRPSS